MNWKNTLSLVGGVTSTALAGIDEAATIVGFIIAIISLLLIVWDLINRIVTASAIRKKALEDGIITDEEQKQMDNADAKVYEAGHDLIDHAKEIGKEKENG